MKNMGVFSERLGEKSTAYKSVCQRNQGINLKMIVSLLVLMLFKLSCGTQIETFDYIATCGIGNKSSEEPYKEVASRSRSQCIVLCAGDEKCKGVNYHKGGLCEFLEGTIWDCLTDGVLASTDITFYQQRVDTSCENGGILVSGVCKCTPCWVGERCGRIPADCSEAYDYADPIYCTDNPYFCNVRPRNSQTVFRARCLIDYGGWTYIQFRDDCTGVSFNQDWSE